MNTNVVSNHSAFIHNRNPCEIRKYIPQLVFLYLRKRHWNDENLMNCRYPKDAEKHLLALKSGLTRSQVILFPVVVHISLGDLMRFGAFVSQQMNIRCNAYSRDSLLGNSRIWFFSSWLNFLKSKVWDIARVLESPQPENHSENGRKNWVGSWFSIRSRIMVYHFIRAGV